MKISGDTPAITDVIVEVSDKDGNSRSDLGFKKYAINSFYMADSESQSIVGYNAETKFLSAVAQLAGKVGEETSPLYIISRATASLHSLKRKTGKSSLRTRDMLLKNTIFLHRISLRK
jgi:hypothetical protein